MAKSKSSERFSLGKLVMTRGVMNRIPPIEVWYAVVRHSSCDWGDVCRSDWDLNDAALVSDSRLLSTYRIKNGLKLWIITEWDRSVTTVLLPEEY